ncbi:MAG: threonine-phosphate decarboxylase CobD [Cyanobacteria bacterium P01_A01_bin.116]
MSRPIHGGNLAWAARLAGCKPSELLDFSASISPLGPPRSVREAVQAAFSWVVAYPDTHYDELRRAIAQHHGLTPEYVLPGNGAAELLTWAAREMSLQTRGCFSVTPGFSDYDRALGAFGIKPTNISLGNEERWHLDTWDTNFLEHIPQEIKLREFSFLLNNPHNPTGALLSRERVRSLLMAFGMVVVDEAFMDFLLPDREQSVIEWVDEFPRLVVLRSLTKFYSMPGIRLGYAIAQPATLQRWQQWRDPWAVNSLAAAAGVAAIQDVEFQQQTWRWLEHGNHQLYEGLAALPGLSPLPSVANFFLVKCEVSATDLQRQLLKQHRLYIRDCISFETLGDRYFRVAVKSEADNQRLLTALAAILPTLPRQNHSHEDSPHGR